MPGIKLTAFTGERPRIIPRLLPDSAASATSNVKLDDGGLTPMNSSVQVAATQEANQLTIFKHNDTWLTWDALVKVATGPVATDRVYYTGDGVPKMIAAGSLYALAVPRPNNALSAAKTGTGTGDVQTRLYTYTYVTEFGEESEPAAVSNSLDIQSGQTVTLSGFQSAPAGRGITKQRIYRSQTGSSGTLFYFIAERDASTSDFTDNVPVDGFGEALPSASWNAPPDDLSGLIPLPNGMMAAFVGKKLYFCEPYRPHAWPEKYVLTVDSEIVGLGALGTSLIVMTKAQPYLAQGSSPDTMQMVKLEANFPCVNARGIVDLGYAIAFPSTEGLIAVTADGATRLVSNTIMSRDDWLDIDPYNYVAGQIGGRYVAFYDRIDERNERQSGAIFFDIGETPYIIRSATTAITTYFEVETSALYYMAKDDPNIYRFDSPSGAQQEYYWRSKPFYMPYPMSYAAIQVDTEKIVSARAEENYRRTVQEIIARNSIRIATGNSLGPLNAAPINSVPSGGDELEPLPTPGGSLSVGIYADGVQVAQVKTSNRPVRLPARNAGTRWEIDVRANVAISQIVMATSINDLRAAL